MVLTKVRGNRYGFPILRSVIWNVATGGIILLIIALLNRALAFAPATPPEGAASRELTRWHPSIKSNSIRPCPTSH
jgi:hypothetical protein